MASSDEILDAPAKTPAQDITEKAHSNPDEDYPTGMRKVITIACLASCTFLIALDNTIIGTAAPTIANDFAALSSISWYGSAFLFSLCTLLLLFGKLYSLFPIKNVYLSSILVFEIGNLISGTAKNSDVFIFGRAVAGIGAAGDFSGGLVTIAHILPKDKRPLFQGLIGAAWAIASVAGPILGGVLTEKASWRWCFYINLPAGAVVFIGLLIWFHPPKTSSGTSITGSLLLRRLNVLGLILFMPGTVALLLALEWGGSHFSWSDARIIVLLVLSGLLLIGFIVNQFLSREDQATIPVRIMKNRDIVSGCWFEFCLGAVMYMLVYYLPLWFQVVKGVSTVKSGVSIIPFLLAVMVSASLAGAMTTASGYYNPPMILSSVLASIGAGLLTTLTADATHAKWIGYQVLLGLGVGFGLQQPLMCAQNILDLTDVPAGTSLLMLMQILGGCIFLGVANNVFITALHARDFNSDVRALLTNQYLLKDWKANEESRQLINEALVQVWKIPTVLACLSILGCLAVRWRSMKSTTAQ